MKERIFLYRLKMYAFTIKIGKTSLHRSILPVLRGRWTSNQPTYANGGAESDFGGQISAALEWKRSFAVALSYLFDGSERLLHNNSLQARTNESRKQKPEPVQKLNAERQSLGGGGRGASKELERRDPIALSQTGISSRRRPPPPPPPPPQYYIVPLSSPAHRWPAAAAAAVLPLPLLRSTEREI